MTNDDIREIEESNRVARERIERARAVSAEQLSEERGNWMMNDIAGAHRRPSGLPEGAGIRWNETIGAYEPVEPESLFTRHLMTEYGMTRSRFSNMDEDAQEMILDAWSKRMGIRRVTDDAGMPDAQPARTGWKTRLAYGVMVFAVLYFGWHLIHAVPGFWTGR